MREEKENILTWLDKKLETAKTVVEKFQSGNYLVDFSAIESLNEEWQEISSGVWVRVIFREKSKILLECKMIKGSILKIHAHPDYVEVFSMKKGVLVDKESDSILDIERGKTFKVNEYHTMFAVQDSEMIIDCIKQNK